jgi:hypothetical protein
MQVRYFGKTKIGERIEFEISGGQIRDIHSMVHLLCTEVGGSLRTSFEIQPFQLAGPFQIEGSGHFSGTNSIDGREYEFSGQVQGSGASGTLGLTYWKMTFDPFTSSSGQVLCKSEVEWSASSAEDAN